MNQVLNGENCDQCSKKQLLIDKYLNLIDLLKKKADKSQLSTTLKRSIDNGNSNTSLLSKQKFTKAKLPLLILKLTFRLQYNGFEAMHRNSHRNKIKNGMKFVQILEKYILKLMKTGLSKLLQQKSGQQLSLLLGGSQMRGEITIMSSQSLTTDRGNLRELARRVFCLERENKHLKTERIALKEEVDEANRRQQIQSRKKKESLEMLAEEMAQKNETITELQATLRVLEQKQHRQSENILEDQSVLIRKELERIQRINDRLNYEAEARTNQLSKLNEQIKKIVGQKQKLQLEIASLKQKNFELSVEKDNVEKGRLENERAATFLQKKLSQLRKYEKALNLSLRGPECLSKLQDSDLGGAQTSRSLVFAINFQQQYKVERILNYLYNLDLQDNWISSSEGLFDQEEMKVLNDTKIRFLQLTEQIKLINRQNKHEDRVVEQLPQRTVRRNGQVDEIYFNQNHVSGSMFDVFNSSNKTPNQKEALRGSQESAHPEQNHDQCCNHCGKEVGVNRFQENDDPQTRRVESGITIKWLEMQIEKNKQVQKISELKYKVFRIRNIMLNLLKSLELRSVKPETSGILDIIFDEFQYSEEEKETIFNMKKKKGFFGFI